VAERLLQCKAEIYGKKRCEFSADRVNPKRNRRSRLAAPVFSSILDECGT